MLRLVHPVKQGQEKRTSKGRHSPALFPTDQESDRIRAAIRNLRYSYGGFDVLASALGLKHKQITNVLYRRSPGSYALAILLARAAGIPVEQLLSGQPHVVGACSLCGRKGAR
jgi:hypothetical protein